MALVLCWSIARLVMDSPVPTSDKIVLNGSGGPNHQGAPAAAAVPVVIAAPGSGARVIVRDGGGSVVFNGDIAFGGTKTLQVSPPSASRPPTARSPSRSTARTAAPSARPAPRAPAPSWCADGLQVSPAGR